MTPMLSLPLHGTTPVSMMQPLSLLASYTWPATTAIAMHSHPGLCLDQVAALQARALPLQCFHTEDCASTGFVHSHCSAFTWLIVP